MTMRHLRIESLAPRRMMASDLAAEAIVRLNEIRFSPEIYADQIAENPAGSGQTAAERASNLAWWRSQPVRQPLAFNPDLNQSAGDHAAAMADRNFFAYRDPTTATTPNERVRDAGYDLPASVPTLGNDVQLIAGSSSMDTAAAMLDFVLAVPAGDATRRDFLMTVDEIFADADEIGIGSESNEAHSLTNVWAINIARRETANRFATGVVFDDLNGNDRFDAGEGLGGVTIASGPLSTTSDPSGLYSLKLSGGNHRLVASGGPLSQSITQDVRIENDNIQVQFESDGDATVNFRPRSLWTANVNYLDVNQDGQVTALDALNVINYLNSNDAIDLPRSPTIGDRFVDVSGDDRVTALDALMVINFLNRLESDSSSSAGPLSFVPPRSQAPAWERTASEALPLDRETDPIAQSALVDYLQKLRLS